MTDIQLKADGRPDKYGLVTVRNPNGTINRHYRITEQELAALHVSGKGVPPGATKGEWESGRTSARVTGKVFDIGDIAMGIAKNKTPIYRAKIAERIDQFTGELIDDFLEIPVEDATGIFPAISVSADHLPAGVSVQNGVITLADKG